MTARSKWVKIAIGLMSAVVIGVGVYVLTQPRKGTVEWHKREYQKTRQWGVIDEVVRRYGSQVSKAHRKKRKEDRIDYHRKELIKLGYLEERVVIIHNRSAYDVLT